MRITNMPNKQIVFVVETNDKRQTDDIYIKKFINLYYDLSDNKTTLSLFIWVAKVIIRIKAC